MTQDITLSRSTAPASPALDIVSPQAMKALFWRLKYLRPAPALFHAPFLFWLTEAVRPRVVVDLGCGSGVAHFAFCQAADKLNLETRCIGIDAWEEGVPHALSAYNAEQYEECGTLLRGDAEGAAARFPDGSIDILHVGLPLEEATIEALHRLWLPKLSDSGVLLLQGTGAQPLSGRARDLLRQLEQAHPVIGFDHGDGMLVILTGPHPAERLLKLAGLRFGLPGHAEAQHIFRRLGTALHLEWQARAEADRADRLQQQLDAVAQAPVLPSAQPAAQPPVRPPVQAGAPATGHPEADLLAEMSRALTEATEKTLAQREELAALNSELALREAGSPDRLAELEQALSRARADLHARGAETAALVAERDSLRAQAEALTADLASTRQHAEAMQALAAENAQRYTDVLNSTSWKLTKPARSLILMTRRGKDGAPS